MNSRERIIKTLNHVEPDRIPIQDGLWQTTLERWYSEGLPRNISIDDYFGYEMKWIFPDTSPQFKPKIIEKTDDYFIEQDHFGEIIKNFKNRPSTPEILDSPVKNRTDWGELKERLTVNESRGLSYGLCLDPGTYITLKDGIDVFKESYAKNKFIIYGVINGNDMIQRYVGLERLLISIAEDPLWVKDMFKINAQLIRDMYEHMVAQGYKFDGVFLINDLGYRNSLLYSPRHYKELLFEYDKSLCDYFHAKNLKVFLHSCGRVEDLIPYFIEAGIDCLHPLEVKAGMDLIKLKKEYGDRISFFGGIDTRLYANPDLSLIEEEIKTKFEIAKKGGGYIYHSDHSIPHDVSLKQYNSIISFVNQYGKY